MWPAGAAAPGHPRHQGRVAVPAHRRGFVTPPAGGTVIPPEPLAAPVIDTHTHLNLHDRYLHGEAVPDPDELLALAAGGRGHQGRADRLRRGVRAPLGRDGAHAAGRRGRRVRPPERRRAHRGAGRRRGSRRRRSREIAVLAREDVVRAVGETGPRLLPHGRGRCTRRSSAPSAGTSTSPASSTRPWSSTTATRTTTCWRCSRTRGRPTASSSTASAAMPRWPPTARSAAGSCPSPGPSPTRRTTGCAPRWPSCPTSSSSSRPTLRISRPCRIEASPTPPTSCRTRCGSWPQSAALDEAAMCDLLFAQRPARLRDLVMDAGRTTASSAAATSGRWRRSSGIRPTKRLGQNFVTDPNTVRRIVRAARLTDGRRRARGRAGPGQPDAGTAAARARRHRRRDRPGAGGPPAGHRGDAPAAVRRPARGGHRRRDAHPELSPVPPTALVANLPYNVAVPVVLHLLQAVPSTRARCW